MKQFFRCPYSGYYLVFLAALVVRIAYLFDITDNPTFYALTLDASNYDELARLFLVTGKMGERFFYQGIFYPLFLSMIYFFSGNSIVAARVVQLALGACTAVLGYHLGRKLHNEKTALTAGIILVFYGPLIFFEAKLLSGGLAAFMGILFVIVSLRFQKNQTPVNAIFLGLVSGIAILVRPEFLAASFLVCCWLAFSLLRSRISFVKKAVTILCFILCLSAVLFPAAFLAHKHTGVFTILPHEGGENLYISTHPEYEKLVAIRPGKKWNALRSLPEKAGMETGPQKDAWFKDQALHNLISHSKDNIGNLMVKALEHISSREIPRNVEIYVFREWSDLLSLLVWKISGFGFPFGVLLILFAVGVIFWEGKRPVIPLLFVFSYSLAILLVFPSARYRLAIIPVMAVFSGYGLVRLIVFAGKKQFRHLASALVLSIIVFGISTPGPFSREKVDYMPELFWGIGCHLEKKGKTDQALAAYEKAVQYNPAYVEALLSLAYLEQLRHPEKSKSYLYRAILADPEYAAAIFPFSKKNAGKTSKGKKGDIRINQSVEQVSELLLENNAPFKVQISFGMNIAEKGFTDSAIHHFHKVQKRFPQNPGIYSMIAKLYIEKECFFQAEKTYRKGIRNASQNPLSWYNYANFKASQGKHHIAAGLYEKALSLDRNNVQIMNNLAGAYARSARLDEAEKVYKKALLLDPDNPGINQNLASVHQFREKMERALFNISRLLQAHPDTPRILHQAGNTYQKMGLLEKARKAYEKALVLQPDYPEAGYSLSTLFMQTEEYDKAQQVLKKVVAAHPEIAGACYNLALAYNASGNMEEAEKWYEKSRDLGYPGKPFGSCKVVLDMAVD